MKTISKERYYHLNVYNHIVYIYIINYIKLLL